MTMKIDRLICTIFFAMILFSCQKENINQPDSPAVVEAATANVNTVCDYVFDANTLTGWTPVFNEEFDGSSVNTANWNIWTGGAFNNELQYYQGANLVVSNGLLSIVAKKEKISGVTTPFTTRLSNFNYTSGRIESKALYSATAGSSKIRMIARIQLPQGYGMWPAFWSYGDPWPTQGEIDILEARGQEPNTYYTNYFYGTQANRNLVSNASSTINSSASLQTCWHVYELIWEQTALKFYLDGQLVDTKTGGYVADLFGKQEKIVLNLAVGGRFFSRLSTRDIVPGTMYIDWVRVYKQG
ncbi:MAG TPA: glycoside hydrolase family 16 protein [Chitinophagaceae bacterium]|nr:glycoside hydrolase family 16 protein [Chitinophagaceae bacterium]